MACGKQASDDPNARRDAARRAGHRDEQRRMSRRSYTFLPWARQGLANRITAAAPAGQLRSAVEVKLALTSRRPRRRRDDERLSAQCCTLRPRRRHRRGPSRDRPHRAARLDDKLRAELSRGDRVLRRGFSVALHAVAAGCSGRTAFAVARAGCVHGRRVRRVGRRPEHSAAGRYADGRRARQRVSRPGDFVGLGARARQPWSHGQRCRDCRHRS